MSFMQTLPFMLDCSWVFSECCWWFRVRFFPRLRIDYYVKHVFWQIETIYRCWNPSMTRCPRDSLIERERMSQPSSASLTQQSNAQILTCVHRWIPFQWRCFAMLCRGGSGRGRQFTGVFRCFDLSRPIDGCCDAFQFPSDLCFVIVGDDGRCVFLWTALFDGTYWRLSSVGEIRPVRNRFMTIARLLIHNMLMIQVVWILVDEGHFEGTGLLCSTLCDWYGWRHATSCRRIDLFWCYTSFHSDG